MLNVHDSGSRVVRIRHRAIVVTFRVLALHRSRVIIDIIFVQVNEFGSYGGKTISRVVHPRIPLILKIGHLRHSRFWWSFP